MGSAQSSVKRCDLCNFKIEDCDEIVPGPADRIYAADPLYGIPSRFMVPGTEINGIFGNTPRLHHDSCARQAPQSHEKPHPAAYRAFEPGLQEDGRRHRWVMRQLACHARMPPIWPTKEVVARPVFREYVAAWNDYLWRSCSNFNSYVNVHQPIYIRYIEYEGQMYIRFMSNKKLRDNPVPVYTPDMRPHVDTVYFAESYFGVVDMVFGSRRVAPPVHQHADIYWRSVPFPDDEGVLKGISDGLKIRTLNTLYGDGQRSTGCETGASLPQPYDFPLRHFAVDSSLPPERVDVFKFNEPGTTGYSICWNQKIVAVHAHKKGEDLSACYAARRDHGPTPVWQYLPIEEGEYIAMTLHHSHRYCRNIYITLRTNRGRLFRLGSQGNLCGKTQGWILIDRHKNETDHIYYQDHPRNIGYLAFDGWRRFEKLRQWQGPQIPDPPFDVDGCTADFFCSTAFLNNVVSVIPCRRQRMGMDVVVGLLLRFRDGHYETLGQVQLDSLDAPINVYGSQEMWLRIEKVSDSYPNVVEVRLDRPPLDSPTAGAFGGRCWFAVNMYDSLEWWYTDTACILQWHGLRSPRIMHRDPLQNMALAVWNNCAGTMDVDSSMIPGYDQHEDFGDLIDPCHL